MATTKYDLRQARNRAESAKRGLAVLAAAIYQVCSSEDNPEAWPRDYRGPIRTDGAWRTQPIRAGHLSCVDLTPVTGRVGCPEKVLRAIMVLLDQEHRAVLVDREGVKTLRFELR